MVIVLGQPTFPTASTGHLPFSVTSSTGSDSDITRRYVIEVDFKKALSTDDKMTIVKTLALESGRPIHLDDDRLEDADLDSLSDFVSSLLDSYIMRHGNGVSKVTVTAGDT